jgi:cytoskeletal protein CcmA (bactofilin family)
MSFTAFGRGSEQPSSTSHFSRINPLTSPNGEARFGSPTDSNGKGNAHPNSNGNGNAHANGNGNGNGHRDATGNGHTQSHADGIQNGNGNGHGNGNGNGSRVPVFRATVSSGVVIKGTVRFRSELVIDGEVEGTIEAGGRLTVGKNGHIRGDIRTRSVTVHGTVDGNVSVGEKCELRSGCTLRGDIETSRLVMDEDVNFTGNAAIATQDFLAELRMPNVINA